MIIIPVVIKVTPAAAFVVPHSAVVSASLSFVVFCIRALTRVRVISVRVSVNYLCNSRIKPCSGRNAFAVFAVVVHSELPQGPGVCQQFSGIVMI